MDANRSKFLSRVIGILDRLHQTSLAHDEQLLAGMIAVARAEAEDALRHNGKLDLLAKKLAERSSIYTWRASDRPPDEDTASPEEKASNRLA
jgi:hypothetical protein